MHDKTKYLKTDTPGLVKDPNSGALLYLDRSKIEFYKKQRQRQHQVDNTVERLNGLEGEIIEIKNMLSMLIQHIQEK